MNPILQDQVDKLLVKKDVAMSKPLREFIAAVDVTYNSCDKDREDLQHSSKILADAQSIANIGSWMVDIVHNRITWSDELYRIFNVDPATFKPSFENFFQFVHQDDRDRVMKLWQQTQKGGFTDNLEYRIVLGNGQVKWVQVKSSHIGDALPTHDGKLLGTLQDITNQKMIEETINSVNERLHLLFDNAPDGYLLIDQQGMIVSVNKAMESMTRLTRTELVGKKLGDLDLIKDRRSVERIIGVANGDHTLIRQEFELSDRDGTVFYIDNRNSPFQIQGEWVVLAMFGDITARHQMERDTEKKTSHLERINKIMVNRELKMVDLKKENTLLRSQLELKKKDGN